MPAHTCSTSRFGQRQGGFAMIALIVLIAIMSAYLVTNALSRTNAELASSREQRSMNALRQAKAALIAYAASEEWQQYRSGPTNFQPGALPCPDNNDTGTSSGICSNAASRVGRLPWATIGSDDLRDASGERLWYAVSSNFYKKTANVINSDTQGLLTVTGTAPASNIVAIVFAPGTPVLGQDRSGSGHNNLAAYLEGFTAGANDYTFTTNALPTDTFNDRLLVITQGDLMSVVEPVVAARIERDVKPYLRTYRTQWGAFPFPAAFAPGPGTSATRAQSAYVGDTTQTSGLLPITASATYTWTGGSGTAKTLLGLLISTGVCGTATMLVSGSPVSGWKCTFTLLLSAAAQFNVQGLLGSNAGTSFPALPGTASVVTRKNGIDVTMAPATIQGALTSTATGTVTYSATYPFDGLCLLICTIEIMIPNLAASPLTNPLDPIAGWFVANEWYRQTYYAVSPGYVPGGGAACNALPGVPSCLTVNNMPAYYVLPSTTKNAILVLAGKTLNSNPRPSPNLADYLEGENSTPADFIYEHRSGVPTSINDRVVVVSP
jgi:type II secretory pathway pseudopilin PulG